MLQRRGRVIPAARLMIIWSSSRTHSQDGSETGRNAMNRLRMAAERSAVMKAVFLPSLSAKGTAAATPIIFAISPTARYIPHENIA